MRILKNNPLAEYQDIKKAIYFDSRCIISVVDDRLICVPRTLVTEVSKKQREWMNIILKRIAGTRHEDFQISLGEGELFYLIATYKEEK
jgi:hypothetical protein